MTTASNETDGDAAMSSPHVNEGVEPTVEAPPPPPPQPIRTPPAALSGLFSRVSVAAQHVGAAAQQAQAPGGLLEVAQRRALRLRENALAEVERLRHQREEAATAAANIGEEFVIPPPAGILIDGYLRPSAPSDTMSEVNGQREQIKQQRDEEVTTNIITKLGDTINMVKRTSREAAEGLIFPRDVKDDDLASNHSSSNDDDDDDDDSSSSEADEGGATTKNDKGNRNDDDSDFAVALATSTLDDDSEGGSKMKFPHPPAVSHARFTAATNVLNAAVGRYRRLKEGATYDVSSPNPPPSPGQRPPQRRTPLEEMPVVGGAEWVGGLRNFHLDGLFDKIDNDLDKIDTIPNLPLIPIHAITDAVGVGDTSLGLVGVPALFDKPPPGRDALTVQTAGQWTMASNRGPNAVKTQESLHTKAKKAVPSSASIVDELIVTSNGATFSRSLSLNSRSSGTSEGLSSRRAAAQLSPRIDDSSPARGSSQSKPLPRTHAYYEQAVKGLLKPGQRALFFGKGTMGVVLKPTYLASWRGKDGGGVISPAMTSKRGGVYIDSFIPGGHAERSGVVFVGDHVIKIGAVNVENMTLEEVVTVIAESKRPNIMVLTNEHFVQVVDKPEEEGVSSVAAAGSDDNEDDNGTTKRNKRCFVSPLDMAFGFVNNLVAEGILDVERQVTVDYDLKHTMSGTSLLDNAEDEDSVNNNDDDDDDANSEEEVSFKSSAKEKAMAESESAAVTSTSDVNVISNGDGSYFVDLASRPATDDVIKPKLEQEIIHAHIHPADIDNLSKYAAHRTNIHDPYDTEFQHHRASLLKRVALFNPDIRCILRRSLLECVSDPRRYSFLEHYFRNYRSMKELDRVANNVGQKVNSDDHDDETSSSNQIRLLDLYLELYKFHDALMLCSLLDREKLLSYARSIAARFLSDHVSADDKANGNCLSDYVGYIALGGMEQVQAVRFALRDEDDLFDGDDSSDGFDAIRHSLESFLSTQESFISFLLSDDCTRMRAYLRGSSSFLRIEPQMLLSTDARGADSASHHNFLLCAILHLVCMKSEMSKSTSDNFIKNDALSLSAGKRNLGAASLLGCAFFIMCKLRSKVEEVVEGLIEDGMTGTRNNLPLYTVYITDVQFLWEVYIAPAGGALSLLRLSPDSQEALDVARRALLSSIDDGDTIKNDMDDAALIIKVAKSLSSVYVSSSIYSLAEALFREYTLEIYPNFQRHIFYEWACKESKIAFSYARDHADTGFEHLVSSKYAGLSKGWLNRFIRQSELPEGISLHRRSCSAILPQNGNETTTTDAANRHCGDVALVFGSEYYDEAAIRRFCCVPLHSDCPQNNVLLPEDIPPIFESYAEVPLFHDRPFQGTLKDRISIDGWEVSLTNFVIPSQANKGPSNEKWIYCVSLVLRKSMNGRPQMSEGDIEKECVCELRHDESFNSEADPDWFQSPLFKADSEDGARYIVMKVDQELIEFNKKIKDQKWSHHVGKGATIGLTLMSSINVMHGMRETLSLLYDDFCTIKSDTNRKHLCQPLVDILGVLTYCPSGGLCSSPSRSKRVETASLRCLVQPYCMYTKSKCVHRPLSNQSEIFLESAGLVLLQSLPPVPLALAFIALLLEQKVVFSSSRRGVLTAASFGMLQLMKPLKWSHLQVPLVPVSMMNELIHYPAPFMLGCPTDGRESVSILNSLPNDVTLVDLDVGRVILASEFANDASRSAEGGGGGTYNNISGAFRSQVLYLAECLGGAFGVAIKQNSWCVDSPFQAMPTDIKASLSMSGADIFSEVHKIASLFVSELLSGIHSCCVWIEEEQDSELTSIVAGNDSAILFDEDQFFHIKNMRAEGRYSPLIKEPDCIGGTNFTISLDNSDLVLETFLRTQCLSSYISDANKESMLFC